MSTPSPTPSPLCLRSPAKTTHTIPRRIVFSREYDGCLASKVVDRTAVPFKWLKDHLLRCLVPHKFSVKNYRCGHSLSWDRCASWFVTTVQDGLGTFRWNIPNVSRTNLHIQSQCVRALVFIIRRTRSEEVAGSAEGPLCFSNRHR